MKVPTYTATIYVGFKNHYGSETIDYQEVAKFVQDWVDKISLCVTIQNVDYIYKGGHENGMAIGFINYPRFPSTAFEIKEKALDLAGELLKFCKQMRVSVVFPDETIMLSNEPEIEAYESNKILKGIENGYSLQTHKMEEFFGYGRPVYGD